MSSSAESMPRESATRRLRPRVSAEESRSGMCRPNTRSGPSAATHSAATTLESMPPDSATTTPSPPGRRQVVAISSPRCARPPPARRRSRRRLRAEVSGAGRHCAPLSVVTRSMRDLARAAPVPVAQAAVGRDELLGGCSWVESTASTRMLSVLLSCRLPGARTWRPARRPAPASKTPAGARAPRWTVTSSNQSGRVRSAKKLAASGAR